MGITNVRELYSSRSKIKEGGFSMEVLYFILIYLAIGIIVAGLTSYILYIGDYLWKFRLKSFTFNIIIWPLLLFVEVLAFMLTLFAVILAKIFR